MSYITHNSLGSLRLTAPADTTCTNAGDYYPVLGTFADGNLRDFTLDTGTGILTYTGNSSCDFIFIGTSEFKADKVCEVTYALAIDGIVDTTSLTSTDIQAAHKKGNVSIVRGGVIVNPNQTLQLKIKSDTASTIASLNSLNMVFFSTINVK